MLGIFPKIHRDTYRHREKDRETHKIVFKQAQVQIHADKVMETQKQELENSNLGHFSVM